LKKKRTVWFLLFLGVCLGSQACLNDPAGAQSRYRIKFATVAPEGTTWMKHMRALAEDIEKESNGRIAFAIYSGATAGDELDVLRRIRIGQIHCAAFSGVGLGQILPMVRVLDLPFLFRNEEEIDLVHRKMRPFFEEEFKKKGFQLLAWAEVGTAHLFSKKPIRTIKDLSGLKVWAWSGDPIAKATFSAMGINAIPLAITDVTTALSTGMIDTVYAPPLGALALQWHTSMKYMMALPLAHSTGAILISLGYFNKLPQPLSEILTKNFDPAMVRLTAALRKQTREAIQLIRDGGLTITPVPSGTDLKEFYAVHTQVARKLTDEIYPKEVLVRVYKILNRSD
jgi:TRAP-type C4-dicarboxylate transport system substrate-binding protein